MCGGGAGREDLPRSLGSVLGSYVVRCLGFRGVASHVIPTPQIRWPSFCCIAVSRDGFTLLALGSGPDTAIHEFRVADGAYLCSIGSYGTGPLQFRGPCHLCTSSDDFVFVADTLNDRVQVLTSRLDFHGFVGVGQLRHPAGVCADDDSVYVSGDNCINVFNRSDGTLRFRFGDGKLKVPCGLCFTGKSHHIAVADNDNHRISVFTAKGEFFRHVGVGVLRYPVAVASSYGDDDLVVADHGNRGVAMFNGCGELVKTLSVRNVTSVVVHRDAVYALAYDCRDRNCIVFT